MVEENMDIERCKKCIWADKINSQTVYCLFKKCIYERKCKIKDKKIAEEVMFCDRKTKTFC